ncbi:hypothetical protein BGW80DRAFT_1377423 [Lactifluus volemus]|nr:hypothetical protein BGW80DRAFT_1377423 [Lactifluus volemus]
MCFPTTMKPLLQVMPPGRPCMPPQKPSAARAPSIYCRTPLSHLGVHTSPSPSLTPAATQQPVIWQLCL